MHDPNHIPGRKEPSETSRVQFRLVRELFEQVEALPEEQRERALRKAASKNPKVAAEAREMLAMAGNSSGELHIDFPSQATILSPGEDLPSLADDEGLLKVPTVRGFKILDPYVAYLFVGKGGFGRVYRGAHLVLGTEVAIKCLSEKGKLHEDAYLRFEREARLGARQKSKHLVQVLDCNQRFDLLYLVMEWVDGEDLAGRISRLGPRPWQETLTLLHGLTTGLTEIHDSNVVHRDIKPANVMLTRTGVVKVADLGLARHTLDSQMQMSMQGVGTPAYMAPEQWDSLHEAGTQADVFSLGATAWHLLAGTPPPRERGLALRQRFESEPSIAGSDIPDGLRDLILHCLEEHPADRPPTGRDVLEQIERLLAEHGVQKQLSAEQVLLPSSSRAVLTESQRSEIRKQWSTEATKKESASDDGPVIGPMHNSMVVGIALLMAVLLAGWALTGLWTGDVGVDPGQKTARLDPKVSSANPKPGKDPATAGANVNGSALPKPKEDPPPPSAPLAELAVLTTTIDGENAILGTEPAIIRRSARKFFESPKNASFAFTWNRTPVTADNVHVMQGERQLDLATLKKDGIPTSFGRNELKLVLPNASYEVTIEQPCLPSFMTGRKHLHGDERTTPYLPVTLPGSNLTLHFVWATEQFLVCATEVSQREWVAFLQSDEFLEQLRNDVLYRDWLKKINQAIEERVQRQLAILADKNGNPRKPELPANLMHVSEAAAYARWLSQQLDGLEVRLPTTKQWHELANTNAHRPIGANGLPFAPADTAANCLPIDAISCGPKEFSEFLSRANPERIWTKPQGALQLYHLGGNVAELCVDSFDNGTPTGGSYRGGSYADTRDKLAVPGLITTGTWTKQPPTTSAQLGFRLILTTPSTSK